MMRMAERVRALEGQNMGDKEWFMRGEANSGAHPCTSPLAANPSGRSLVVHDICF